MRIVRLILLGSLAVGLVAGAALAGSHDDPIVVIDVGDPMDQRSIDYVVDVVQSERAHLYILKIDSPGRRRLSSRGSGRIRPSHTVVQRFLQATPTFVQPHPDR